MNIIMGNIWMDRKKKKKIMKSRLFLNIQRVRATFVTDMTSHMRRAGRQKKPANLARKETQRKRSKAPTTPTKH